MTKEQTRLLDAAKAVVASISFDDSGVMVGMFVGGNGGLLSRDTIKRSDELRRAITDAEYAEQRP